MRVGSGCSAVGGQQRAAGAQRGGTGRGGERRHPARARAGVALCGFRAALSPAASWRRTWRRAQLGRPMGSFPWRAVFLDGRGVCRDPALPRHGREDGAAWLHEIGASHALALTLLQPCAWKHHQACLKSHLHRIDGLDSNMHK